MHIPSSTYRLQFTPTFGFRDATLILPYLSALGISDVYASPIFKTRKGSTHGYDIIDPNALNDELGTLQDFEQLIHDAQTLGLSWLQDIVPNHMAFDGDNRMLMDLLENGHRSCYCGYFDIDWEHPSESLHGKVLAPFLGKFYSECLENGEIHLQLTAEGLSINYYDLCLPLRIESYHEFLRYELDRLEEELGDADPDFIKYLGAIHSCPDQTRNFVVSSSQITYVKALLWQLYENNSQIQAHLDRNLAFFNGSPGIPQSFDLLDTLLSEQTFRLSFWKFANEEINYRRFFTINELISMKVEDRCVFEETHKLIFRFLEEGKFNGLRIDHVDGLYDPTVYLQRLKEKYPGNYLIVEKILAEDEELPHFWPVHGSSGYEFLNQVNGVFVATGNETRFNRIYARFIAGEIPYDKTLLAKKRLISGKHLAGNIDNLARCLKNISSHDRYGRDITLYGLKRAMVEVMAQFTVYRTYVNSESARPEDLGYIESAVNDTLQNNQGLMYELMFIEKFMRMAFDEKLTVEERTPAVEFVMQMQQLTGPLMAKSFEDTFFYVYNRFISLNEVGSHPDRFGIPLVRFHEFNGKRVRNFPHSLLATATHDTKRGEDVRARINVLSELPEEWERHLRIWKKLNAGRKEMVRGNMAPDSNDEYFLYQTLIGAFPFDREDLNDFSARIREYVVKAVREAKIHTDWLKPMTEYEDAYAAFAEQLLDAEETNPFLDSFLPFQRKIAHFGIFNSLSQTLLKITAPGVPDFYRGSELWDLSLVDPDNRTPMDFEKRMAILQSLSAQAESPVAQIHDLLESKEDGRIKLFLIQRGLRARKKYLELFRDGDYIPLNVSGRFKDHVISFMRKTDKASAVIIAPRWLSSLLDGRTLLPLGEDVWQDTIIHLPQDAPGAWIDQLSGGLLENGDTVRAGQALGILPVSLLIGKES